MAAGVFYGVGVGPGDPELLTLKAVRLIREADFVVYLANEEGQSQARHIARYAFDEGGKPDRMELPLPMPMSNDRTQANIVYNRAAEQIAMALDQDQQVIFLCEGDPLLFGSFSYLLERLSERFPCEVVPGISSINAAAATLVEPLVQLKESFAVISGRQSDEQIEAALNNHDALVILKAGLARPRLLNLLQKTGRTGQARYLEYIGRENQKIERDVASLTEQSGPYFSLFVVLPEREAETCELSL